MKPLPGLEKHVLEDTSLVLFYAWEQQLKFELKDRYIVNTFRFDVQTEYVSGENFLDKIGAMRNILHCS